MMRGRTDASLAGQMQAFARTQMFEIPNGEDDEWEDVQDDGWKMEGCAPVYRKPQAGWKEQPNHRKEEIWFIPELFGSDDSAKPKDQSFGKWVLCIWDAQAGRWVIAPKGSSQVLVHFKAPSGGIPARDSKECTIVSYSDGRELSPEEGETEEKKTIHNKTDSIVSAVGQRNGWAAETTNDQDETEWQFIEGTQSPLTIIEFTVPNEGTDFNVGATKSVLVEAATDTSVTVGNSVTVTNYIGKIKKGKSGSAAKFLDQSNQLEWRVIGGGGGTDTNIGALIFKVPAVGSGEEQTGIAAGADMTCEVVLDSQGVLDPGDPVDIHNWTDKEVCRDGDRTGAALQYGSVWKFYEGQRVDPDMTFFRSNNPGTGVEGGIPPLQSQTVERMQLKNGSFVTGGGPNITVFNFYKHTICGHFSTHQYKDIGLARRVRGNLSNGPTEDIWVAIDFARDPVFLPANAEFKSGTQSDGTSKCTWTYDFQIIGESQVRSSLANLDPAANTAHKPTRETGVQYTKADRATVVRIADEYYVWDINEEQTSEECTPPA